ncbi:hypothetical protein [Legionella drancourtii]|uniref:Uncharacterized protein n=1 Tax=Legionella drancourtii LLAP12 TaxID=658187 RepID=G9EKB3_9GAMM|nr:hypothetical protein [Legionella drancourtii]EHL32264.1 hypothetical protein LDG_5637 [Legionella drancourtii LLAP12]
MTILVSFPALDALYSSSKSSIRSPDAILAHLKKTLYWPASFKTELLLHTKDANSLTANSQFVFELEMVAGEENRILTPSTNKTIRWNYNSIAKVHSLKHRDSVYDLAQTWVQLKEFERLEKNLAPYIEIALKTTDKEGLAWKIGYLSLELKKLEGQVPYTELKRILKITIDLLEEPTAEHLETYKALTTELQKRNPLFAPLGLAMLALGGAIIALGLILTPFMPGAILAVPAGAALALAGLGIVAEESSKNHLSKTLQGLKKKMPELSKLKEKIHQDKAEQQKFVEALSATDSEGNSLNILTFSSDGRPKIVPKSSRMPGVDAAQDDQDFHSPRQKP